MQLLGNFTVLVQQVLRAAVWGLRGGVPVAVPLYGLWCVAELAVSLNGAGAMLRGVLGWVMVPALALWVQRAALLGDTARHMRFLRGQALRPNGAQLRDFVWAAVRLALVVLPVVLMPRLFVAALTEQGMGLPLWAQVGVLALALWVVLRAGLILPSAAIAAEAGSWEGFDLRRSWRATAARGGELALLALVLALGFAALESMAAGALSGALVALIWPIPALVLALAPVALYRTALAAE